MILHMIQLEPESRLSAESYLQTYAGVVFPGYFSPFLHNFYCCCNPLPPDARVILYLINLNIYIYIYIAEHISCYRILILPFISIIGGNVSECFQ